MIVDHLGLSSEDFAAGTGWEIKPEGACKSEVCVPLGAPNGFDPLATAERLGMAVVSEAKAGLWAFGPESLGGRALVSAEAPDTGAARPGRQRVSPIVATRPEGHPRRLGSVLRLSL